MSNKSPTAFVYKDEEIEIEITYGLAMKKFRKMGLNLLAILSDEQVMATMLLDDSVMVQVWHHYVEEETGDDFDTAIDELDPHGMKKFRDAFWQATINFTPPAAREVLEEGMKEVRKQIRLQGKKSKTTSSDSSEEQEED